MFFPQLYNIYRVRDSCKIVRECIAIQWVSTAVQYKCSYLYPIELATRYDNRTTSDKTETTCHLRYPEFRHTHYGR